MTHLLVNVDVDDLAAAERFYEAAAAQEQAVRTAAWGRIALMADPFGHGYCLIEFSVAGYDAIASRDRGKFEREP